MRMIGELAGIDQSGIMHYFPSKEALMLAVLEQADPESAGFSAAHPIESLADVPNAMLDLARANMRDPAAMGTFAVLEAVDHHVVAGPRAFVETVCGASLGEALAAFRDYVERMAVDGEPPEHLLDAVLAGDHLAHARCARVARPPRGRVARRHDSCTSSKLA